jgi:hypothetical protein
MTWNISTSRNIGADLEIFKMPPNEQGFKSIVLDASTVASGVDGVFELKAGTLLSLNVNDQYERFTGAGGQEIVGVLALTIRFPDNTAKSDAPAPMAFHGEVFRADRIIDFNTHAAAARAALTTCLFQ